MHHQLLFFLSFSENIVEIKKISQNTGNSSLTLSSWAYVADYCRSKYPPSPQKKEKDIAFSPDPLYNIIINDLINDNL